MIKYNSVTAWNGKGYVVGVYGLNNGLLRCSICVQPINAGSMVYFCEQGVIYADDELRCVNCEKCLRVTKSNYCPNDVLDMAYKGFHVDHIGHIEIFNDKDDALRWKQHTDKMADVPEPMEQVELK